MGQHGLVFEDIHMQGLVPDITPRGVHVLPLGAAKEGGGCGAGLGLVDSIDLALAAIPSLACKPVQHVKVRNMMEGWKDGRMEGWRDGRMEGWMDGRKV